MQSIYQLPVSAPFLIPGFPSSMAKKPEILIRFGHLPAEIQEPTDSTPYFQISTSSFLLKIPGIACYLVKNQNEIVIAPEANVEDDEIALFLMDMPFTVLLQLRGFITFRGTALTKNGQARLLLGPAGTGKSTLAEKLLQHGYSLFSDFQVVADGEKIYPGRNFLSLWQDIVEQAGYDSEKLERVRKKLNLYRIYPDNVLEKQSFPLERIFFPHQMFRPNEPTSKKITGQDKIAFLWKNLYGKNLAAKNGFKKKAFSHFLSLVQKKELTHIYLPHGELNEELIQEITGEKL